jgi:MFS family permease
VGAFLVIQTRLAKAPIMPLRIFRSRALSAGNTYLFLLFGAMFGTWYFETLFMQRVLGYSPLSAGLAFLPQTILIAIGSQIASRLVSRVGSRPILIVGTALSTVGVAWLSRITPHSVFLGDLFGPFVLVGLGMGLSVTPATVAATAGVPREDAGLASGLLNTSRFIGASIGLAVLATVAASRTAALVAGSGATPSTLAAAVTGGYARAIVIGVIILFVAGIVAAVGIPPLRRAPAERTHPVRESDSTAGLAPLATLELDQNVESA